MRSHANWMYCVRYAICDDGKIWAKMCLMNTNVGCFSRTSEFVCRIEPTYKEIHAHCLSLLLCVIYRVLLLSAARWYDLVALIELSKWQKCSQPPKSTHIKLICFDLIWLDSIEFALFFSTQTNQINAISISNINSCTKAKTNSKLQWARIATKQNWWPLFFSYLLLFILIKLKPQAN